MSHLHSPTATEIRASLASGDTSARALVASALNRIDTENPALNAVVQRCDKRALATADAVDQALAIGQDPGSLAEIPVTV